MPTGISVIVWLVHDIIFFVLDFGYLEREDPGILLTVVKDGYGWIVRGAGDLIVATRDELVKYLLD